MDLSIQRKKFWYVDMFGLDVNVLEVEMAHSRSYKSGDKMYDHWQGLPDGPYPLRGDSNTVGNLIFETKNQAIAHWVAAFENNKRVAETKIANLLKHKT